MIDSYLYQQFIKYNKKKIYNKKLNKQKQKQQQKKLKSLVSRAERTEWKIYRKK